MRKLYIDIGGTHLRSQITEGSTTLEASRSSRETGLLGYIDETVQRYPDIGFIGIAYAGQVHGGRILSAPNIDVDEPRLREVVRTRYGIALEIDNDLNCAVMAEARHYGATSVAALYVGTGLGAAVIDGGRLVRGGRNLAFEIGHIPYRDAPFACGCGRSNCVELYASGSGMAKWLRHCGDEAAPQLRGLRASPEAEKRQIAEGFDAALLHAAGTLVTLANPELLVLGGGIVGENPELVAWLEAALKRAALNTALEGLRIEASTLKNAPIEGAKLLEERYYG